MGSLVAGVDIGAATSKALLLSDGQVLSYFIMETGPIVAQASSTVIEEVLSRIGASRGDLKYVVSTGWGRDGVPFANKKVSEIICHAKGAHFLIPGVRSIIDIGGQDSKAISLDENGTLFSFVMNDKCAAGTGRFFEVMAKVLEVELTEIGVISLKSKKPCQISSTCTVFAETEVVAHRAEGSPVEDLLAGIIWASAKRVAVMARQVNPVPKLVFTGGVAKNVGVKKALEEQLGLEMVVPEEPQIIGALGAALLAQAELGEGGS